MFLLIVFGLFGVFAIDDIKNLFTERRRPSEPPLGIGMLFIALLVNTAILFCWLGRGR